MATEREQAIRELVDAIKQLDAFENEIRAAEDARGIARSSPDEDLIVRLKRLGFRQQALSEIEKLVGMMQDTDATEAALKDADRQLAAIVRGFRSSNG
jgi:hypothetical protein